MRKEKGKKEGAAAEKGKAAALRMEVVAGKRKASARGRVRLGSVSPAAKKEGERGKERSAGEERKRRPQERKAALLWKEGESGEGKEAREDRARLGFGRPARRKEARKKKGKVGRG